MRFFNTVAPGLIEMGFTQSKNDPCMFTNENTGAQVGLHADDVTSKPVTDGYDLKKNWNSFLFLFHRPPTFSPLKTACAIFQVRLAVDRLSLCRVLESCIVLFIYRHVTLSLVHLFHVLTSCYLLSIDKLLIQL